MPRKPRFNLIGIPQHVIQRGNNREPCFYSEEDYRRYLEDLREVITKYDCRVHAYVLMTNHVHLLMTPMVDHGISQAMQAMQADANEIPKRSFILCLRYGESVERLPSCRAAFRWRK